MANEMYESLLDDNGILKQDYIIEKLKKEGHVKLDYKIEEDKQRVALVKLIVDNSPPSKLTPQYLEVLTKYLVENLTRKEKRQHNIITQNIKKTMDKREASWEELSSKNENGEDGLYNMIANDKNIIFAPKTKITKEEREKYPELDNWCKELEKVREKVKNTSGADKYKWKKIEIEMAKDQYVIRNALQKPIFFVNVKKSLSKINFDEQYELFEVDEGKDIKVIVNGTFSLLRPQDVSILLRNYTKIKEDSYGNFWSDAYYIVKDLENIIDKYIKEDYPLLFDILVWKIDGKPNEEIKSLLLEKYGSTHSIEYISSLWRNKIPKIIANKATDEFLEWHFTNNVKGKWKRCSKCGQIKLAYNRFFSKNNTSKDGFYSICKQCRNKKTKKK